MDEILKLLYSVSIPVFGILVLLALAFITEIEGIVAFFGRPSRELHDPGGKLARPDNSLSERAPR